MNVRRNEKIDFVGRGKSVGMLIHEGEWKFEYTVCNKPLLVQHRLMQVLCL